MNTKTFAFGIAAALTIGVSVSARANLIVNGSFENPTLPSSTYQNHLVGSNTLTGWEVVGPSFESLSQVRSDFAGNPGYSMPAEDGDIWLDLAGFVSNSPSGIKQTIITLPGATYDLNFWVGNITGTFFGTETKVGVEFSSGGADFSCTNTMSGTVMSWQLCGYSFVATDASTSITFRNLDPSNDYSAAIDNISLTQEPMAAIPEPTAWAILLAGLAAVQASARGRLWRRAPNTVTPPTQG